MVVSSADDPILTRFRRALEAMYGERLNRVLLFGSCARGDGQSQSDYDIAVFLDALPDRWAEASRLAALRVRFIDDEGVFFDTKPYLASAYRERSPLLHEIHRDGLDVKSYSRAE